MEKSVTSKNNAQDHPRIRGTNIVKVLSVINLVGSSPHTRDKFLVAALNKLSTGIIPAYAGQIRSAFFPILQDQDHPRIRGTNASVISFFALTVGSSPHTRDKCRKSFALNSMFRIIPAYAGQIMFLR